MSVSMVSDHRLITGGSMVCEVITGGSRLCEVITGGSTVCDHRGKYGL